MAAETTFVTTMRFPLNSNIYHTQLFFTREELANHNQQHGIYPQTELAIRKYAMENIERLGRCLRLPWRTHATAKALFNRFYATHAMTTTEFSTVDVAQVCLFISCKIEETNKKLKEIIVEYGKEFNQKEPDEMDCERTKKEYLNIERVVLETIGFDFRIFHPQKFVIKFCDKLSKSNSQYDWQAIARSAWLIASDSYKSPVSLLFPANVIACSCILLSTRIIGRTLELFDEKRAWCCQFFCDPSEVAFCERDITEALVDAEEYAGWKVVLEGVLEQGRLDQMWGMEADSGGDTSANVTQGQVTHRSSMSPKDGQGQRGW